MKLTVGPLPPAVYWRRRALIAGAVLVVLLLIVYSCSDSGADDGKKKSADDGKTSSAAANSRAAPAPSVLSPTGPEPSHTPPVYPPANATSSDGVGAAGTGPCDDSEISVSAAAEHVTVRHGGSTKLFIKIKNVSGRTCVRDVGANMQELYLQQGATKQWSSDACQQRRGNQVETFPPSHEQSFWLNWEGKATNQGCESQPLLAKGTYQLHARLGTKISDPVPFTVTG